MNEIIAVPERFSVKEGFHHDLKAKAIEELRGPTFPWENGLMCLEHIIPQNEYSITYKLNTSVPLLGSSC